MCGGYQAYLSTCHFWHSFWRVQVLVVLDIQSKLEPEVLAEYKHLTSHNHLPDVRLQFPDCFWRTFIQKTTNMISLIVILHDTFFKGKPTPYFSSPFLDNQYLPLNVLHLLFLCIGVEVWIQQNDAMEAFKIAVHQEQVYGKTTSKIDIINLL